MTLRLLLTAVQAALALTLLAENAASQTTPKGSA